MIITVPRSNFYAKFSLIKAHLVDTGSGTCHRIHQLRAYKSAANDQDFSIAVQVPTQLLG